MMTCPVDHSFDPLSAEYLADPYSQLARLRDEQPVFFSPELNAYVVTRYDDIDRILMSPEEFGSSNTVTPMWPVSDEAKAILATAFPRVPTLTNADGQRHARMRRYVARVLAPRRIVKLRSTIEATANRLLDEIVDKDISDLYADLAYPLPAVTAFALLGFPPEDIEMLKSWVTDRQILTWGKATGDQQVDIARNIVAFSEYIEKIIELRMSEPQDDAISELLAMHREEPEQLNLIDIANIVFLLSAGAHESTTNLLVHAMRRLLENPQQWQELTHDQTLITNAVEEALRYDASAIAWPRITSCATTVGGVELPAGASLLMVLGSANRDLMAFNHAGEFDIRRPDSKKHISFGKGIHFCLGAPLARIEADVVLNLITTRLPNLELVPGQTFPYQENAVMRSPQELLVAVNGGASRPVDAVAKTRELAQGTIVVDRTLCVGSATCLAQAPDAFALDAEDKAVTTDGVLALGGAEIRQLIAQCPTGAISVEPR
jgi:cytochrome P450/ferredoxin